MYIFVYTKTLKKMTRLEKLETLVKIEEAIQSFINRIDIAEEIIEREGSYFREIRDVYTDKKDTYLMCIVRLEERLNKQLNILNK